MTRQYMLDSCLILPSNSRKSIQETASQNVYLIKQLFNNILKFIQIQAFYDSNILYPKIVEDVLFFIKNSRFISTNQDIFRTPLRVSIDHPIWSNWRIVVAERWETTFCCKTSESQNKHHMGSMAVFSHNSQETGRHKSQNYNYNYKRFLSTLKWFACIKKFRPIATQWFQFRLYMFLLNS